MSDKKKKNRESREETIQKLKELKEAAEKKAAEGNKEAAGEEAAKDEKAAEEGKSAEAPEAAEEKAPEAGGEEKPAEEAAAAEPESASAREAELKDRLMRQMAEFENFRRRTEKEKQAMFETGAKSVIEKLLPVVDNFERGLAALSEEEAKSAFAEGMRMVYKQLMDELDKLEVKAIEAVGKEFDPNLHNAVMHVEDEESPDNTVVEELQKGYTYRDSVVRHSMVKVAN